MIGLDTNILLRLLLHDSIVEDDAPGQRELIDRMVTETDERFFINHVVIAETVWLLKNKVGNSKETVRDVMNRLLTSFNVEVDRPSTVEAALESFLQHPGGFADHLIGKINRDAGCRTTMTFDKAATRSPDFSQLMS
ncbi:MAG: PIN domain-containing protein [Pararhizobium sp.]